MFSGSPFLKSGITLVIFIFSRKKPISSDILNKCFRCSLISPKYLLATLKFISSYFCYLLLRKKPPLTRLLIARFSIISCFWFKKLVKEFEEFGTFLAKFGPTFVKKLLNSSAISISFFFSITIFLGKLDSVLRVLPISSLTTPHVFFALFLNSNILLE